MDFTNLTLEISLLLIGVSKCTSIKVNHGNVLKIEKEIIGYGKTELFNPEYILRTLCNDH